MTETGKPGREAAGRTVPVWRAEGDWLGGLPPFPQRTRKGWGTGRVWTVAGRTVPVWTVLRVLLFNRHGIAIDNLFTRVYDAVSW